MEYEIRYSARRTIGITVTRKAEVVVHAPIGTPKRMIDKIVREHAAWIEKHLAARIAKNQNTGIAEEEIPALREEARAYLTKKTAYYAARMGLRYGKITITGAKTRFGSCNSKGNISYSYRLMKYPEAAREYVVVHELAHLVEMNHSPRFYAVVERVLPDYRERRKLLKT